MVVNQSEAVCVCALYKFYALPNFTDYRDPLLEFLIKQQVKGTLLLAHEGINGTIAGAEQAIDKTIAYIAEHLGAGQFDTKKSFHQTTPFLRTKVKLKKEIVTMGVSDIDPQQHVGTYVEPSNWNALISDPDVLVIDTRNDYEYEIGSFQRAVNPETNNFRQFPDYVQSDIIPKKPKKVAMFCTGGIRCEKSTAYLKKQGIDDVYHLKGGILNYLKEVPEQDSLWYGECFVFDERVAVNHQLEKGQYDQCYACRYPLTEAMKQHEHYTAGVSCPRCIDESSFDQKQRFQERQKQIDLSKQRGEQHLG